METKGGVVPLVKLVLYTGDEILRRLVTSLSPPGVGVVLGEELMGHYEGQDTIPSGEEGRGRSDCNGRERERERERDVNKQREGTIHVRTCRVTLLLCCSDFDHIPLEGIDTTNILESLTKRHHVLLTGWVKPISPLPPLSLPPAPPTRPAPSRYMGTTASHSRHSSTRSVETPPTNAILPKLSVSFADTVIKEFQGRATQCNNQSLYKYRLDTVCEGFYRRIETE